MDGIKKNPNAVILGRLGGLRGGKARAEKLTPERRTEIARNAANKRWGKEPLPVFNEEDKSLQLPPQLKIDAMEELMRLRKHHENRIKNIDIAIGELKTL